MAALTYIHYQLNGSPETYSSIPKLASKFASPTTHFPEMSETPQQEFTLVVNGTEHHFKARTFAKVSRRGGQLIRGGTYYYKIQREIPEEAANAFVQACYFKEFKVTTTNAFDLLDLSSEWKITNLERFVKSYIAAKGLVRPEVVDNTDYLEILLEKIQNHEQKQEDYDNVSKRLDKYFEDDRLLTAPVIVLFKLILGAEYSSLDEDQLAKFIMRLIVKQPHAAVPLLMRINYEKLSPDQDRILFNTPQVHDLNTSFFISSAYSHTRNRIERALENVEKDFLKALDDARNENNQLREENIGSLNQDFRTQIDEMKNIAAEQLKQIEDIKNYREKTLKRRQEVMEEFDERMKELNEQRSRVRELMDRRKEIAGILIRHIDNEIAKHAGRVREDIMNQLNDVRDADQDRIEVGDQKRQDHFASLKRNVERMKINCRMLKAAVKGATDETDYARASLAAKMVKDFMRFDNFIRRVERRFKIFDEQKHFELTGAEVNKAEQDLNVIEKRIDKICPIRHSIAK